MRSLSQAILCLVFVSGCVTTPDRRPAQSKALNSRAGAELGCDEELAEEMLGGETKPDAWSSGTESVWSVTGCGKRVTYVVKCNQPGGLRSSPWECNARLDSAVETTEE